MNQEDVSVDKLIEEIHACLGDTEEIKAEQQFAMKLPVRRRPPKKSAGKKAAAVAGKVALVAVETLLLVVVALYGVMYILAKGPSPTARDLFVRSVRETSAIGFLANLYFSEEEIQQIVTGNGGVVDYEDMDTSLIEITKPTQGPDNEGPQPDAWGLVDDDGDGIILEEVKGSTYSGYMMVVLDPSRVIMGSVPEEYGIKGYTVADMVERFGAVAGVNAGGFEDPNGQGNGSIPETMVVYEGKLYYEYSGTRNGFCGFDSQNILHVGSFTAQDVRDKDIQYGVSFGPVLVVNGQIAGTASLNSGLNPRTAIGQRSDGAVLLLVIDGRQVTTLGASYMDLAEIFLSYGAVNAYNLDGGSSTMLWYRGEYVNNCSSVVGIRPVPTTFLVMPEGWNKK